MEFLAEINEAWGWTGLKAKEIVGLNEFGNFLLRDVNDCYWRIIPEDLSYEIVAQNSIKFSELLSSEDFRLDWEMANLVQIARQNLGSLKAGWTYYLVIPSVFGGVYDASNIRSVPLKELIQLSGKWAREIEDLPDGAKISMHVIE